KGRSSSLVLLRVGRIRQLQKETASEGATLASILWLRRARDSNGGVADGQGEVGQGLPQFIDRVEFRVARLEELALDVDNAEEVDTRGTGLEQGPDVLQGLLQAGQDSTFEGLGPL